MNKWIVKFELIAELIYLIILLSWGLFISVVTSLSISISFSEKFFWGVFITYPLYLLLYIFSIVIIFQNIEIINQNLNDYKELNQTNENNITLFAFKTLFTIIWLVLSYSIFSSILVMMVPTSPAGWFECSTGLDFFKLFCGLAGIYWSIAYALMNSDQTIKHFAQNKKLSLFNKFCFAGSIIPGILLLIAIVLQIPMLFKH